MPALVYVSQFAQVLESCLHAGFGKPWKRSSRGCRRAFHVRSRCHCDSGNRLLSRGIDYLPGILAVGGDPAAINIKTQFVVQNVRFSLFCPMSTLPIAIRLCAFAGRCDSRRSGGSNTIPASCPVQCNSRCGNNACRLSLFRKSFESAYDITASDVGTFFLWAERFLLKISFRSDLCASRKLFALFT